jgi:hypothetical protein
LVFLVVRRYTSPIEVSGPFDIYIGDVIVVWRDARKMSRKNKLNASWEASARCLSTNTWHLIANAGRDISAERDSDLRKIGRVSSGVDCLYLRWVHLYVAGIMSA